MSSCNLSRSGVVGNRDPEPDCGSRSHLSLKLDAPNLLSVSAVLELQRST